MRNALVQANIAKLFSPPIDNTKQDENHCTDKYFFLQARLTSLEASTRYFNHSFFIFAHCFKSCKNFPLILPFTALDIHRNCANFFSFFLSKEFLEFFLPRFAAPLFSHKDYCWERKFLIRVIKFLPPVWSFKHFWVELVKSQTP